MSLQASARETYAGDLQPRQAWNLLRDCPDAMLIDVRTDAEWEFVGLPDLDELAKDPLLVSWQAFPDMQPNAKFVEELCRLGLDFEQPLLFVCRSGVRSRSAAQAMTDAGYRACYNVAEGFEGDKDEHSRRGAVNGWKVCGLPWKQ